MKNLLIVIKSSLALALLSATVVSAATDVVRISRVKGTVFGVAGGRAQEVHSKSTWPENAEIMTEEGAQVTLTDFYDHTYHVSPGSQVIVKNKSMELRSGNIWVQAFNRTDNFKIQTINGQVEFNGGEFLISFNAETGKTQLMVISGQVDFANLLEGHLRLTVDSGHFSIIDQKYQQGMPRTPTPVGFDSFKKITNLFDGVVPMDKAATQLAIKDPKATKSKKDTDLLRRSIASVAQTEGQEEAPQLSPASVTEVAVPMAEKEPSAADYLFKMSKKHKKIGSKKAVGAEGMTKPEVHIYRLSFSNDPAPQSYVAPAKSPEPVLAPKKSNPVAVKAMTPPAPVVNTAPVAPERTPSSLDTDGTFQKSLQKATEQQPRHKEEVLELIDELKTYKKDFQSTY